MTFNLRPDETVPTMGRSSWAVPSSGNSRYNGLEAWEDHCDSSRAGAQLE